MRCSHSNINVQLNESRFIQRLDNYYILTLILLKLFTKCSFDIKKKDILLSQTVVY